jgi:hypothetical protein
MITFGYGSKWFSAEHILAYNASALYSKKVQNDLE